MAKGSAMGLWRGKKGSSVFYKIKNSNSLQKQGIRERIYEVANPQSNAQCAQRMRLLPAQHVYGALKDVIERSWQGVKYGEMSRQAFLKGALALGTDVPFLRKAESKAVPGAYQIAKGSLQEVVCSVSASGFTTSLVKSATIPSTIGELSTDLLTNNLYLKEGDQISFVLCTLEDGIFLWNVASFILDSNSTETFEQMILPNVVVSVDNDGFLQFESTSGSMFIVAAAVIISREGTTPQRSNATLAIDKTINGMSRYFSEAERILALTSYKKAQIAHSTDWPVDPEVEPADPTKANVTITYNDTLGSVTGAGQYNIGDSVTVTASPKGYADFVGWYLGSTRVSQSQSYTFTIEANTALEARFQEQA